MSKRHYKFTHLQSEQVGSPEHIEIEDSYSVNEELIFGKGEHIELTRQVDHFGQAV